MTHEPADKLEDNDALLLQENALLRGRIAELVAKDGVYHQRVRECERETSECHEKSEEKLFALRLDYESRVEHLTHQTSEQQMEIITLRQMYETVYHEKNRADQQVNECRLAENAAREKCDQLQMEYDYLVKTTRKPFSVVAHTQTVGDRRRTTRVASVDGIDLFRTRMTNPSEDWRNQFSAMCNWLIS